MAVKTPTEERQIIVARDHRRKYGARVEFQVPKSIYMGDLGPVSIPLPQGTFATLHPKDGTRLEKPFYELRLDGYSSATEAEDAGMAAAQGLLLAAISMNFGMRLNYRTPQPAQVFDRTAQGGFGMSGELVSAYSQHTIIQEISDALQQPLSQRGVILSMELFTSAALEANDRTQFVTAVSALEPLAEQLDLGDAVAQFAKRTALELENDQNIPDVLKPSLRGRILQLRRESVRQALHRLCDRWFPGDLIAQAQVDFAYELRSKILHEGRADPDLLLAVETQKISRHLRSIYAQHFGIMLRSPAVILS
jgi:hypothetical protein